MTNPHSFLPQRLHRLHPVRTSSVLATIVILAGIIRVTTVLGAYQYYYTDNLTCCLSSGSWTQNGTVAAQTGGLTASSADGGTLISTVSIPDGTSDYEVNSFLTLSASGGSYTHYLRASSSAKLSFSPYSSSGTFYAVDLQNIALNSRSTAGSATLSVYKRVGSTLTVLASASVAVHNGMMLHSIIIGTRILVYIDNFLVFDLTSTSIPPASRGLAPGRRWPGISWPM
jgi:hypothetical protein